MTARSTLALDYRPIRFGEVVGQNHIKPILKAMVKEGRVPPSLIFNGTRGTGKTTCARIFAAALNCTRRELEVEFQNQVEKLGSDLPAVVKDDQLFNGDACGECHSCVSVQQGNSTSVLEIDAASSGGVDDVRRIQDICMYAHEAEWRVVILDEAHSMSKEAYNALLKMLEEPPAQTVFVLVTTEPEKILGTVRSRSMPFEFRRLKNSDLTERLRFIADSENIPAEDSLLDEVAKSAQGGMRDAVMFFDQVSRVGVSDASGFRDFYGISDYSLSLMWSAIRGDHAEGYRLVAEHFSRTGEAASMVADLSRLTSELLVIKSEGRPTGYGEAALEERVEMSRAVDSESLVKIVEILWELRARTRATENDQRSSMEMGFALIAASLRTAQATTHVSDPPRQRPVRTPAPVVTDTPSEKLTLADIRRAAAGR